MRSLIWLVASTAALVMLPVPTLAGKAKRSHPSTPPVGEQAGLTERHLRYNVTVRNTAPTLVRDAEVRTMAPVRSSAGQKTIAIRASMPFETETDAVGNQTLTFRVTLPPFASKVIAIDASVALADRRRPERLARRDAYLAADEFVEVDDPALQRAAASITESKATDLAPRLVSWVADHVEDAGYVSERRGALVALRQQRGDCTDAADLLVAVARARKLPARRVAGFVLERDAVVRAADYHDWAEVYADGTWRIADPNKGVFDAHSDQYVAMRVLDPVAGQQLGGGRTAASDPSLTVTVD